MNEPLAPHVLAIDAGTSSLKTVAYDQAGRVVASASRSYGFESPRPGWAEADPNVWWQALQETVSQLHTVCPGLAKVHVVAITGQMHTAVLLDAQLRPIEPTILWLDRRASAETEELQRTWNLPPYQLNTTYTLPKLLWLKRHKPEVMAQVRHILWPKDYLRFRMTGRLLTDTTEAGGAALLDWETLTWATERLERYGIDPAILPPLHAPGDDAGPLLPTVARELGLTARAKVIVGAGDVIAMISAAPPMPGQVTYSLGSSSMIAYPLATGQMVRDPYDRLYTYPLPPYRLFGGTSSTTGAALQWVRGIVTAGSSSFQSALSDAATIPPGADGLIFLPFLSGERSPYWNDALRGGFYGLNLFHTRAHLVRATLEGVAYSLRYLLDIYREVGISPEGIALAGGGSAVSGWPQIIANVCRLPLSIYAGQETVTRALFAYACSALPGESPFEEALRRTFGPPDEVYPQPEVVGVYDDLYAAYRQLADFANRVLAR